MVLKARGDPMSPFLHLYFADGSTLYLGPLVGFAGVGGILGHREQVRSESCQSSHLAVASVVGPVVYS